MNRVNNALIDGSEIDEFDPKPTVSHFVSRYLFVTGSWIYSQLVNLQTYRPFVLTSTLENEELFPFDAVYCYQQPFTGNGRLRLAARKGHEALTSARKRYFIERIRAQEAVLLHAHFGTEGYYHLNVQEATRLPLITTYYGADMSALPKARPKWNKRYQRLFAKGALFLAEGPYMAQALVDLGCPPSKVRVQHLGVDVERIEFVPRQIKNDEPVRILMAGSFREKKGIPYGIRAFAQAVRRFPDLELRIVGGAKTGAEQALMNHCQRLALSEGVSDKVVFMGYVSHSEYLKETQSAHLFMAPSVVAQNGDTEGGAPVSVIEASAAGMPVIASHHCDIPNVVVDSETGILVPERDVETLEKAILELANSPELWPLMGRQGRQRVERDFDVFKQIIRLEKIYDHVLGS